MRTQFVHKYGTNDVSTLDVSALTPGDIITQLTAVSLFSPHRMVIVRGVTAVSDLWRQLESTIDHIAPDTVAVLTDDKITGKVNNLTRTRTFTALKKADATINKFDLMTSRTIRPWLTDELKRRRLDGDYKAISRLIELTAGEDNQQARLMIELDKLALLHRPLTVRLVDDYVEPSLDTNAFGVFSLIVRGNRRQVATELRRLERSGEDANRFLGLMASQLQALAVAVYHADVPVNSYQLQKAEELAHNLGGASVQQAKLKEIAAVLANLDAKLKKSNPDQAWQRLAAALLQLV